MTIETVRDRILILIKLLAEDTPNRFAEMLGIHSSYLDRWLNKGSLVSSKHLQNFHSKLNINLNWLLAGNGEMFVEYKPYIVEYETAFGMDAELLINYKQLSKEHRKDIQNILKSLLIAEDKEWLKKEMLPIAAEKSSIYGTKKKTQGR